MKLPASTPLLEEGRFWGAVYEVSARDLRQLNSCQGYPGNYNRLNFTVFDENGNPVEAIIYIKARQLEETQPSSEYLLVIQQGCRDWGIV